MKILLDTHILLWTALEPDKLPANIRHAIENNKYPPFVSMVSLWEIAIKANIGKISLPKDFFSKITNSDITLLNITTPHIETYIQLPMLHRDPFDRMLIAQAKTEGLTIASSDAEIKLYGAPVL